MDPLRCDFNCWGFVGTSPVFIDAGKVPTIDRNVYMSCASVAPKFWEPQFVQFINTRGREKMMFGTEYPTIPWVRGRNDTAELGLRENVEPLFFVENAKRAYQWDANP